MEMVDDLVVTGRRVLVRAGLNVPLDGTRITDDGVVMLENPGAGTAVGAR